MLKEKEEVFEVKSSPQKKGTGTTSPLTDEAQNETQM